jgi:hypothetical protein
MDFDRWFSRQGQRGVPPPVQPSEPDDGDLPDGVWYGVDNGRVVYYARCRSCERTYELPCDVSEFHEDCNYCGRNPWCCP